MENQNKIIPPHLNSNEYKSCGANPGTMPYLDYIRIHRDGTFLVGCSELTGRYWNGSAYIFKPKGEVQNHKLEPSRAVHFSNSIADGCFIENSNKIFLCEDTGSVSVWTKRDTAWGYWEEDKTVSEHDDLVLAVDCLVEGATYVTVSQDTNIKVWDVNELICVKNYESAHENIIYDVSVRPNSTSNMATCSLDRSVRVWDDNTRKPVLEAAVSDCGVRSVKWLSEHSLVFGDNAGALYSVDVRKPDNKNALAELPAPVHRILVKPESNHVGVCCDNKTVSVFDVSEDTAKLIYQNNKVHSNYVRGIAWDISEQNCFHSVGWDNSIKTHKY